MDPPRWHAHDIVSRSGQSVAPYVAVIGAWMPHLRPITTYHYTN